MTESETREHRQHLGAELRRLRELAGLTTRELAARLGVGQGTISRSEAGQRVPSLPQVTAWAEAVQAREDALHRLVHLTEVASNEVVTWRMAFTAGTAHLQGQIRELESEAQILRSFQPTLVPGLLQTAEYARRVITLADATGGTQNISAAVAARIERQQSLYTTRTFEFLMTEAAVRWPAGPVEVMLGQLDRIASIATLTNVRVGLIPSAHTPHAIPWHGFVLYEGHENDPDPYVRTELIHAQLTINDPDDVELYRTRYRQLAKGAVYDEEARALLSRIVGDLLRA